MFPQTHKHPFSPITNTRSQTPVPQTPVLAHLFFTYNIHFVYHFHFVHHIQFTYNLYIAYNLQIVSKLFFIHNFKIVYGLHFVYNPCVYCIHYTLYCILYTQYNILYTVSCIHYTTYCIHKLCPIFKQFTVLVYTFVNAIYISFKVVRILYTIPYGLVYTYVNIALIVSTIPTLYKQLYINCVSIWHNSLLSCTHLLTPSDFTFKLSEYSHAFNNILLTFT